MVQRISLSRFAQKISRLDKHVEEAVVRGLRSTALRLQGMVVEEIDTASPRPAVDRGELRNSVETTPTPTGAIVAVNAPHAGVMEYGARPFFPPTAPLAEWAKRKGIATTDAEAASIAYAIALSISRNGIAPRGYFAKAWRKMLQRKILREEIDRELAAVKRLP